MKKVFMVLAVVASLFVGVKSASAMTEEKLKEVLTKTYTINGGEFKVKDEYVGYIDQYLNAYDISEEHCQYISDRIDEAIDIIKKSGKSDLKALSNSQKTDLRKLVEKISANTSVKATVEGNTLIVNKPDQSGVFARVDNAIKQTGSESNTIAIVAGISFLVTVVGALLVVRQVKHS